jgi:hypothetical protein
MSGIPALSLLKSPFLLRQLMLRLTMNTLLGDHVRAAVGGEFPNWSANTPERTRHAVTPPESDAPSAFTQDAEPGGILSGQHDARSEVARFTPPSASDTARDSVAAIDTN